MINKNLSDDVSIQYRKNTLTITCKMPDKTYVSLFLFQSEVDKLREVLNDQS